MDFRPDGAWRVKAQRVAALRHQLMAAKNFTALNARTGDASSMATTVSGTLTVPTLFFAYSTTDSVKFMRDTAEYTATLFGTSGGNPYTLRTYYDEMSDNRFHLAGRIMGWVRLANPETNYTGSNCTGNPFGTTNCNGIWSSAAVFAMQNGFREALQVVDQTVDFSQFDNDGPDEKPNSGDDDGIVDMIMFAHPTKDGACGGSTNNHIWSHRFVLVDQSQSIRQDYVTNDPANPGNKNGYTNIHISDYFATSALGGSPPLTAPNLSPCDTTQIMPIGTAAHEFGHALGLPDLYDTGFSTEGIGSLGLMGSGNFTSSWSPSRMESWSLSELGWVNVLPITSATPSATYTLGPAPTADVTYRIDAQGGNPRREYFLIDNRQASQADTALVRTLCGRSGQLSPPCAGGLLIWHVDSTQIAGSGFHRGNAVNVGTVHGLRLMQADGLGQLDDPNATGSRRRGDAGDFYPGVTGNTAFTPRSNPSPLKNIDASFAGFAIDQITQVVPGGDMTFRVRFGQLTIVQAALDTNAIVKVDGAPFNVFRDLLDPGNRTISIDAVQSTPDGRRRFTFQSWSDGGLPSHTINPGLAGGNFTATVDRDYKLIAMATSSGTIAADTALDPAGTFFRAGRIVQLTATPDPGKQFFGWSGDIKSFNTVITAPMDRPYTVTANFGDALTTANVVAQLLGPTQPLTAGQIQYLDAGGNGNGLFDIGDFLAWVKSTGAPLPASVLTQLTAGNGGARR
jgi:M6 family metalloprotease-like protein